MNMFVVDSNFIVYSRLAIVKHRIRYCFDIDEARIHYLNTLGPILLMHTSIIIGIYEIWTISPILLETLETLLLGNTIHFVHKSFRKTMTYLAIYGSSPPSFIISYCDTFGVATAMTCNNKTVFTGVMEHQRPVWRRTRYIFLRSHEIAKSRENVLQFPCCIYIGEAYPWRRCAACQM